MSSQLKDNAFPEKRKVYGDMINDNKDTATIIGTR